MNLKRLHYTMMCTVFFCYLIIFVSLIRTLYWHWKGMEYQSGAIISAAAVLIASISAIVALYQYIETKTLDLLHAINLDASNGKNIARAIQFGKNHKDELSNEVHSKDIISIIERDESRFMAVLCTLGTFDDLALSVKAGVANENMLFKSCHGFVLRLFQTYYQYIRSLRESHSDPYMYISLEWLYERWAKKSDHKDYLKFNILSKVQEHLRGYDS